MKAVSSKAAPSPPITNDSSHQGITNQPLPGVGSRRSSFDKRQAGPVAAAPALLLPEIQQSPSRKASVDVSLASDLPSPPPQRLRRSSVDLSFGHKKVLAEASRQARLSRSSLDSTEWEDEVRASNAARMISPDPLASLPGFALDYDGYSRSQSNLCPRRSSLDVVRSSNLSPTPPLQGGFNDQRDGFAQRGQQQSRLAGAGGRS